MVKHYYKEMRSPVGRLKLISNTKNLVAVLWQGCEPKWVDKRERKEGETHPVLKKTQTQLNEYFAGKRITFDIPLESYGTVFQKKVWKTLRKIPYGKKWSYLDIAQKIGSEKACRAVGGAIGKNPISIIVPCHRVIGKNGTLTGFAGGLKAKKFLLELERGGGEPKKLRLTPSFF